MRIELSERLRKIAAHVASGDCVADIGTDHGYLPVWLLQNQAARHVIISDINEGPLEKAAAHIRKYDACAAPDLRLGAGLTVLAPGEADVLVIAGMGGILISRILADSPDVVQAARQLVLQPRNHGDSLRLFLRRLPGFRLVREEVAREGRKFSEILIVVREDGCTAADEARAARAGRLERALGLPRPLLDEVPPLLFVDEGADRALLRDYMTYKCRGEDIVIESITQNGRGDYAAQRLTRARARRAAFAKLLALCEDEAEPQAGARTDG